MRVTIVAALLTLDLLGAAIWWVGHERIVCEPERPAVLPRGSASTAAPRYDASRRAAPAAAARLPRPKAPGRVERIPVAQPAERREPAAAGRPTVRKQPSYGSSCNGPVEVCVQGAGAPPTDPAGTAPWR